MLEGEKNALILQVNVHIKHLEKKLKDLGLVHAVVHLVDRRTGHPIHTSNQITDMAEGKPPVLPAAPNAPEGTAAVSTPATPSPTEPQ